MAMGGSMTEITQASTRYTPRTRIPWSHWGALTAIKAAVSFS